MKFIKGHFHLVGVAGVGMSAIAQALVSRGCRVTGSDRYVDSGRALPVIGKLKAAGIEVVPQDGRAIGRQTAAVVVSSAIENDNCDVMAASQLGVCSMHRSNALAMLVGESPCIAVAGTSGKSTVTGMIGWILEQLGFDPTVVNGAPLVSWDTPGRLGNFRPGRPDLWVIEADESDRSLLNYRPDMAVITNASADHFNLEETLELFAEFARRVQGELVSALDGSLPLSNFRSVADSSGSTFRHGSRRYDVRIPGSHNAENALAAVMLCEKFGCNADEIVAALSSFRGIRRRLEHVGAARGVTVVDDYGHNPAKIAAAWETLAPSHKRVFAIWRPHGYGPLRSMMTDLAETFGKLCGEQDRIFLLPVYDAGGTATRDVRSEDLFDLLHGRCKGKCSVVQPTHLVAQLIDVVERGDVVLFMGARDPDLPLMARETLSRLQSLPA